MTAAPVVTPAPAHRPAPAETVVRSRAARVAALDALKVLMVAGIIAAHGALGYSGFDDSWPYQSIQEGQIPDAGDGLLFLVVMPGVLFTMGLFFLVSGLLTPPSLARKGPRRFARDRFVRLGLPLLVWVFALWPGMVYAAHRQAGRQESYWAYFVHTDPFPDTGPLWFVEVLLIYSVAYALWRSRRPRSATTEPFELSGRMLVRLAVAVSAATAVVRIAFPLNSFQFAHLNLWQWPQYLVLFGLGIAAAERGGIASVPDRLWRRCRLAALLGFAALILLSVAVAAAGLDADTFFDERLHWATMGLALIEGPAAVGASIWFLGLAPRVFDRPPGPLGRAFARGAFAAFVLQGVVLIGLSMLLRPVGVPVELKAILVPVLGVAGSFALGWALVTRTPVGRVL